jgi:hypothetical protein
MRITLPPGCAAAEGRSAAAHSSAAQRRIGLTMLRFSDGAEERTSPVARRGARGFRHAAGAVYSREPNMNKLRLLLVAALCADAAQAQEARPARSVKFIVPSSPGETPA